MMAAGNVSKLVEGVPSSKLNLQGSERNRVWREWARRRRREGVMLAAEQHKNRAFGL